MSYRINILFRVGFILAGVMLVLACSDSKMEEKADVARRLSTITKIYQNGNFERALYLSKNLVLDYPNNPIPRAVYGGILFDVSTQKDNSNGIEDAVEELAIAIRDFEVANENNGKGIYKFGIVYAMGLNRVEQIDDSIRTFVKYYEPNVDVVNTDPELRYSVIDYAEALAKKGYLDASYKVYARTFKVDNTDARLVQGFIELESDYGDLQDAISFADAFIKKHGFSSRIIYEKCRAYYNHKLFSDSANCFNELMPKINSDDVVFDAAKEFMEALEVQKHD